MTDIVEIPARVFARVSRYYVVICALGLAGGAALLIDGYLFSGLVLVAGFLAFGLFSRRHWVFAHLYSEAIESALTEHVLVSGEFSFVSDPPVRSNEAPELGYVIFSPQEFADRIRRLVPPYWTKSPHRRLLDALDNYSPEPDDEESTYSLAEQRVAVVSAANDLAIRLNRA